MNYKNSQNFKKSSASLKSDKLGWQDDFTQRLNTLEDLIASKIKSINGLILRKKGRGLINILLRCIYGVRPRSSKSVVKQVVGFAFYVSKMAQHSGLKGVVIYLKACQVLLQQSIGGYRVLDLSELKVRPRRNKRGIPLIIPAGVRVRITRDRDISSIRLWMTLLGLYRILEFPGKLSLDTIIQEGTDLSSFLPEWEEFLVQHFNPNLKTLVGGKLPRIPQPTVFPILKSGPTTFDSLINSSPFALIRAARTFLRGDLKYSLKVFSSQIGIPSLFNRVELVAMADETKSKIYKKFKDKVIQSLALVQKRMYPIHPLLTSSALHLSKGIVMLGKLGFKIEAAGKVRVFAMVDAWTQWLMYPLHKWLFEILSHINEDGTFDQLSPISRIQDKFHTMSKNTFSSIDLSAATDRLPISLQKSILKILLKDSLPDSEAFANAWADLLVKRAYLVAPSKRLNCIVPNDLETIVTYSVGQPMGALSSWAMLAMTHHAIIQFCYYKAYGNKAIGWFENYGVLGDDVVIADGRVAEEYRRLLQVIGVKAGLAKSIIAKGRFVVEFAKKFFVDNTTANMLPFKECIATLCSTSLVVEFVRKYELNLNAILSVLGFGYKTKSKAVSSLYFKLPTRLRVLLIWLSHPSSPLGKDSYKEWLFQRSWNGIFHYPSPSTLDLMVEKTQDLLMEKFDRMNDYIEQYNESIEVDIANLDKEFPILITAQVSSTMDQGTIQKRVPWKAIVNPDMKTSPEEEYDFLTGGMSVHSLRFKQLEEIKLGVDPDLIDYHIFEEVVFFGNLYQLEVLLELLFKEEDISSQIPKKFWQESREVLKPFSDFLETYRIWQEVTQPLWSDYYKSFQLTGLDLVKSKHQSKEENLDNNPLERGDLEGSPTLLFDKSKDIHTINILYRIFNSIYGYFLREGNLLIFILSFMIGWLLMGHLYTDSHLLYDWEPVIFDDEFIEDDIEDEEIVRFNLNLYLLIGSGIILLLCLLFDLYMGNFSFIFQNIVDNGVPIITEDPILRYELGLPGPLSLPQLEALQNHLEVRAWEANLALSPIGDLWISPWLE